MSDQPAATRMRDFIYLDVDRVRSMASQVGRGAPEASTDAKACALKDHGFDGQLYSMLRDLREKIAKRENAPPYIVIANKTLEALARFQPATVEEAVQLPGIGVAKAQRYEEALGWLDRALAVDPAFGPAHLERAKILFQLGRPDRAVGSFDRACQLMPRSFEAHYLFGGLLANAGDKRAALPLLERALALQPDGPLAATLRQTIDDLRAAIDAGK